MAAASAANEYVYTILFRHSGRPCAVTFNGCSSFDPSGWHALSQMVCFCLADFFVQVTAIEWSVA